MYELFMLEFVLGLIYSIILFVCYQFFRESISVVLYLLLEAICLITESWLL